MNSNNRKSHPSPLEKANFISKLFYWWTRDIFKKAYRGVLTLDDIYDPLKIERASLLGDSLDREWKKQLKQSKESNKKPSLFKALLLTFKKDYLFICVLAYITMITLSLSPVLLGLLLECFRPESTTSYTKLLLIAGAFVSIDFMKHFMTSHMMYNSHYLGSRMKIAIYSIMYRKVLRLDSTEFSDVLSGKIVSYMAIDLNRIDFLVFNFVNILCLPLCLIIVLSILYIKSGYATFIGMAGVFILVPLQGNQTVNYRLKATLKSAERVRLISEIVSGIKVIKMYSWEKPFNALVESARRIENKILQKSSCFRDASTMFNIITPRIALYCTFIAMIQFGQEVTAQSIFVILPFFYMLSDKMFVSMKGFFDLKDYLATLKKIQQFLELPEYIGINYSETDSSEDKSSSNSQIEKPNNNNDKKDLAISMNELTISWNRNSSDNILENISLKFQSGKLHIVIGMVGSGKSSLLASILGEITKTHGHIECQSTLSYANQETWIFGGTVRNNILFGEAFDQQRYNRTIEVCCLQQDLKQLSHGDLTMVGEKGTLLSGGQKARINLARAVYKEADIYLLDDPLSAVDTHVGKFLFQECIVDYLQTKTRILVTHQIQYIKNADSIILVEGGRIHHYYHHDPFFNDHPEYKNLLAVKQTEDSQNNDILEKHQVTFHPEQDIIDEEVEDTMEDQLKSSSRENLLIKLYRFGSNWFLLLIMCLLFILTHVCVVMNDFFVLDLINAEKIRNSLIDSDRENLYSIETYIYIYTALIVSIILIGFLRSVTYSILSLRGSKNIHNSAFKAVMNTKLKFFHENPSGRILDRFSEDVSVIDDHISRLLMEVIQILSLAVGAMIVVILVDYLFIVPAIIIFITCYWLRGILRKTMGLLGRLGGIVRPPVYTHLSETLNGVSTIRAHKAEKIVKNEFNQLLDLHTSVSLNTNACKFAFGLVVKLLTAFFVTFITFTFIVFKEHFNGGQVGLAITQIFCMTELTSYGIILSINIANLSTSIERLLQYTKLPPENKKEKYVKNSKNDSFTHGVFTSLTWPYEGHIRFENVFLRYAENDSPVLKNLNFEILSKEKIGIVGRTGAGKSSIISALFRLAEIDGSIIIDGIDTATVSLETLRSRISIIPQDPVLFSGTLRRNLDPFGEFSDDDIWDALDKVELRTMVALSNNGLDFQVSDKGSNYSVGQRQLVCLARAVLRRNCILVLDEATANVDPQTDALIQKTIRTKFLSCTVLTIAHRLNTIIDSNRVMVIDNGQLVEFDHPYKLLSNNTSQLTSLVKKTGYSMHKQLFDCAEKCYKNNLC